MGVDPLEEASKMKLFFATLAYKAKIGVTTFLLRIFVKRVLTRVVGMITCILRNLFRVID